MQAIAILASRVGESALCGREHPKIPVGEADPALDAKVAKNGPCFFLLRHRSLNVALSEGHPGAQCQRPSEEEGLIQFAPRSQHPVVQFGGCLPVQLDLLDHGKGVKRRSTTSGIVHDAPNINSVVAEKSGGLKVSGRNRELTGPVEDMPFGSGWR